MEYRKLKDQDEDGNGGGDDIESRKPLSVTNVPTLGGTTVDWSKWKLKIVVVVALTLLTSSQGILIVWSKRNGKYEYSVTTSNFMVEALKCGLSLLALARIWRSEGVTEDNRFSLIVVVVALTLLTSSQGILIVWSKRNGKYEYSVTTSNFMVEALKCGLSLLALARIWRSEGVTEDNRFSLLSTTLDEVIVYPIPALLYLVKNLLQYYILEHVDAPGYQILKNLNIISTGVLYRIILKKKLSNIQWAAFILLCAGCSTTQLKTNSDDVFQTPVQGWVMAIVMALLSGFAGVYTEAIMKKRPSRNINVQNFWLYVFGMVFNAVAIVTQDFDAVMNKGFFYGYSFITVLMILNHALSGLAVSMVMKYADNIVKVYATSVAMLFTAFVSFYLFGFNLSLAFILGTIVVMVSVYLHAVGKQR
ncbi:cmp-sialic acid transporter 4 [Quercus suber]|uniref:Cmp-sialic acid transporter 4 n=1 Tax=Quercus suber TaxID=58331 RepID=A0AAW0JV41_QUESU